mmetsp:Transcript_35537/g.43556  ORF Transcript_35537/g.43556 Transcript_35537/m.43556 type:complete len:246 (+) Transcript_35537:382-1119(+)
MHPGVIGLLLQEVVSVNVDFRIRQSVLRILQVHGQLCARLSHLLPAELAIRLEVLNEVGEFLGAESAEVGRVCLLVVESNDSWGDLSVIEIDIVVLGDLLTCAEIHEAKVNSIAVDLGQTGKIPHHVVRRLVQTAHVEGRVSEHDDPGLVAGVGANDPVRIALVIEEANAARAPLLVDPVVEAHPVLFDVDTETHTVRILAVLLNELGRDALEMLEFVLLGRRVEPLLVSGEVSRDIQFRLSNLA